MAKKVVVGMSGGVDSSVAAYLLKKQGYEVIGVTMHIWQDENKECADESGCCGFSAVDDARIVAEKIDIPYYVLNFKNDFKKYVIDYFTDEYLKGFTPNPCIACNTYVKWESLLKKALQIGADYIATGHYARVIKHPITKRYTLETAVTEEKDQTYALYGLTQKQLSHTLMPVGEYNKDKIRKIAYDANLPVANKPDSQDICFVPDNNYSAFIEKTTGTKVHKGNFVDTDGNILGKHEGIYKYTIGQRKGLGIAFGRPMYVCGINHEKNEIILGENETLFKKDVLIKNFNFMGYDSDYINNETKAYGKIRYSHKKASCTIKKYGNLIKCVFEEPQRAVTPGQAAVFYDSNNYIIGGGTIVK